MRSSKPRSRNKNNRNNRNSLGNVVNRVFDSNGPEGKVRGTPQQIIEKYNQLARDSALGNDRVATENFQQHAEHYLRMLNEAQKEQEAKREQMERENRERQAQRDRERAEREAEREKAQEAAESARVEPSQEQPDTMFTPDEGESGLVETPETHGEVQPAVESKPRKPRAPRKPRHTEAEQQPVAGEDTPKPARAPRRRASRVAETAENKDTAPDTLPDQGTASTG